MGYKPTDKLRWPFLQRLILRNWNRELVAPRGCVHFPKRGTLDTKSSCDFLRCFETMKTNKSREKKRKKKHINEHKPVKFKKKNTFQSVHWVSLNVHLAFHPLQQPCRRHSPWATCGCRRASPRPQSLANFANEKRHRIGSRENLRENPYISWGKPWFPLIYATKFEKNNKKIWNKNPILSKWCGNVMKCPKPWFRWAFKIITYYNQLNLGLYRQNDGEVWYRWLRSSMVKPVCWVTFQFAHRVKYAGFPNWGYPKMDGLFLGKSY